MKNRVYALAALRNSVCAPAQLECMKSFRCVTPYDAPYFRSFCGSGFYVHSFRVSQAYDHHILSVAADVLGAFACLVSLERGTAARITTSGSTAKCFSWFLGEFDPNRKSSAGL
jgi:hypothetical protein